MLALERPIIGMPGTTLTTIADNAAKIAVKARSREDSFNFIKTMYFSKLLCKSLHNTNNVFALKYLMKSAAVLSVVVTMSARRKPSATSKVASDLSKEEIYPYIVFLPPEKKYWVLRTVFGSKVPIDVLKFSIKQGISKKIYQKDLVRTLSYSNKTIIQHLKMLTKRGILKENMEKSENRGRTVWVKYYILSDIGKWFALLLAEETDLTKTEKTEIFRSIFKSYVEWAKEISQKLGVSKAGLQEIFNKEVK